MTVCTIIYDDSAGSDTLCSGSNAPTAAITGTNGDISGTTITLNETVDFGAVNDDGTDVVYYTGNAGDRHLFTISSFTGGSGTCTALVVDQTATAPRTASNWAVGGKRQTLWADTTNPDVKDAKAGWRYELEANGSSPHYSCPDAAIPYTLPAVGDTTNGGIVVIAASGHSPKILYLNNDRLWDVGASCWFRIEGISMENSGGSSFGGHCIETNGANYVLQVINCTMKAYSQCVLVNNGGTVAVVGCDAETTSAQATFQFQNQRINGIVRNNVVHDGGKHGIECQWGTSLAQFDISRNIVYGCTNHGIYIDRNVDSFGQIISNNTCHNNGGDGINLAETVNSNASICFVDGNILTDNGGYGIGTDAGFNFHQTFADFNAFRGNASGEVEYTRGTDTGGGINDVTITNDPYVNAAAFDFTLNDDVAGGGMCKGMGLGQAPSA